MLNTENGTQNMTNNVKTAILDGLARLLNVLNSNMKKKIARIISKTHCK